jgi:hypothetical protein
VRRTALITGASAGIGESFAKLLAARGTDLVLVARRRDRLDTLAEALGRQHAVRTLVVPADLGDPAASAHICERLWAAGLQVDILVNNAGYAVPGSYRGTAWERQSTFLQVMVVAYAELTHRLLPPMIEHRWGRIINVASLAGLAPGLAGQTLYGASKAFLIKFSQSLAMEVERHGVHVHALCPGYTYTEFHDVMGVRAQVNRIPRLFWLNADAVAREGLEAVERGRVVRVPGAPNRVLAALMRVMPESLVFALARRFAARTRHSS